MASFPFYRQLDQMDCGPSCIRMIAKYHGRIYSGEYLREKCYITREGVSMLGMSDAAEAIGMRSLMVMVDFPCLLEEVPLPCIAHWRQRHFVVVHKVTATHVFVADPAFGKIKYSKEKFLEGWLYNKREDEEGILLLLEPSPDFYEREEGGSQTSRKGLRFLGPYFKPYGKYLVQLLLGLVAASILQLIFPFLTQSIVDYGINQQNIGFIYLILVGQLMLFFSQTSVELIRSWILLHLGTRVNIAIISDFLIKIMKLPIAFFDSKMIGDLLQRIEDHRRIETFLSSTSLDVLFSAFSLLMFGFILAFYSGTIFGIFLLGTILYIGWVLFFIKKRAILDYKRHDEASENRSSMIQLIQGMQEIKLNNSERRRRWEWEGIQMRLFKISIKSLTLAQYQTIGGTFINELKNILITFVAATSVIEGHITLGMMLAIQYILGQLNGPINSFIRFVQSTQDATLSIDRLTEIHDRDNEIDEEQPFLTHIPKEGNIRFENVSFQYGGPSSRFVLTDVHFEIPRGKVTAIVGASGSGKTTLLKLLLKFYPCTSGHIQIGHSSLDQINSRRWRQACGVVMQDGFIFADTIARNISESNSDGLISKEQLLQSVQIANLTDLIEELPMGYNTNLSWSGVSLSGGEEQRVLIARAVYKNPDFLFFDEATSALDANNERLIMENLESFYKGRTVVVIAHRLSTVKKADQIIVLDQGQITEIGTHESLTDLKGMYYALVKNQLELGR
ncbi:MAG: peptidase domain-containing ABC transporter [Bacteroidota bacterium]